MLKNQYLKNVEHAGWDFTFSVGFMVSQPRASVSQLPAALRLPQKKHMPLEFWNMHLADFVILKISRLPKPFAAVSQLPADLRLPQQKHSPEFEDIFVP